MENDLEVFQLQLDNFKSCHYGQFSSFKQPYISDSLSFKSDLLCNELTLNDENFTQNLFHHIEKETAFLSEKLKSKNTIITLFLEYLVKLKDNNQNENSSIHLNNDVKIAHLERNSTRTTQSIEIMETGIPSRVTLNIAVNESNTRYQKSNQVYTGDKTPNWNDTETSQNEGHASRRKNL